MNWESWSAFWQMGGAGFYVWGSYGVTFLCLAIEIIVLLKRETEN